MMEAGSIPLALVVAGMLFTVLPGWAVLRYLRGRLWARYARLEDTLQVYRNANAGVGRHVTVLEAEVRELRERLAAMEGMNRPAPATPVICTEPDADAEERLSRLIRSRLGEPRAVV